MRGERELSGKGESRCEPIRAAPLQLDSLRIARRAPKRQNVDGAAILIDGVDDPVLGASADAEQVAAVRCAGQ